MAMERFQLQLDPAAFLRGCGELITSAKQEGEAAGWNAALTGMKELVRGMRMNGTTKGYLLNQIEMLRANKRKTGGP